MAAARQELSLRSQAGELPQLNDLDSYLSLANEFLTYPDRNTIGPAKTQRDIVLLRIQNWADHYKDILRFDSSFIYADDPKLFLAELVSSLESIRPRIIGEPRRAQQEITEEYEKAQAVKEAESIVHEAQAEKHTVHDLIEHANKRVLLSRREAALIAEHIETTEALTQNPAKDIDAARDLVAQKLLDDKALLNRLGSLLPEAKTDDAKNFLATHLAESVQAELSDVKEASDITATKIKNGVAAALSGSDKGRSIISTLETDPQLFDNLAHIFSEEKNAKVITKAGSANRQIAIIFKEVGGEERLRAFADASIDQIEKEALEELINTLGVSGRDKDRLTVATTIARDLRRSLQNELFEQGEIRSLSKTVTSFIGDHPGFYLLGETPSITRVSETIEKRSSTTVKLFQSAQRLVKLRYPKDHASENISLLSQVTEGQSPFFGQTLAKDEGRLLGLLGFDEKTLSSLEKEYRLLAANAKSFPDFQHARQNLLLLSDVRRFREKLEKDPRALAELRSFWQRKNLSRLLGGSLSSDNPRFNTFIKNLTEVTSKRYYENVFSQKLFGVRGPSYTQPPTAYISNMLTNVLRPRFSGTDLIFRNGRPHLSPKFTLRLGSEFNKLKGLGMALKAMPVVGTALSALLADPKRAARVLGAFGTGLYFLSNLAGSLIANFLSFAGTSIITGAAFGFLGQLIGIPFPIGFGVGVGVNTFVHAAFGGWGGAFSALGTTINGFLGGLSAGVGGVAAGVGGLVGGILGGGILAASAVFATIAVTIGTLLATILAVSPTPSLPPATELAQCTFVRNSLSTPIQGTIKSGALVSLMQNVAQLAQIPAPVIAAVAFVENATFVRDTADDHIVNNYYYYVSQVNSGSNRDTNAIGLMQVSVGKTDLYQYDEEGNVISVKTVDHCSRGRLDLLKRAAEKIGKRIHDEAGDGGMSYYCLDDLNERVKKFCQTNRETVKNQAYYESDIVTDDNYINLCRLQDSLMVGAEVLVDGIAGGQWTEKASVDKAIKAFYGSCEYPSGNYCDEVWSSYQACQPTQVGTPVPPDGGIPIAPLPVLESILQAAGNIVQNLRIGSERLYNIKADEPQTPYYWCTYLIVDSYNRAGLSELSRRSHAAVVTMKVFFGNTQANGGKYRLLPPDTPVEQLRSGDVIFFEGQGQHASLIKSFAIDENGNGVIRTYEANNVVLEDIVFVRNHRVTRAQTTQRIYGVTGFGQVVSQ